MGGGGCSARPDSRSGSSPRATNRKEIMGWDFLRDLPIDLMAGSLAEELSSMKAPSLLLIRGISPALLQGYYSSFQIIVDE